MGYLMRADSSGVRHCGNDSKGVRRMGIESLLRLVIRPVAMERLFLAESKSCEQVKSLEMLVR